MLIITAARQANNKLEKSENNKYNGILNHLTQIYGNHKGKCNLKYY